MSPEDRFQWVHQHDTTPRPSHYRAPPKRLVINPETSFVYGRDWTTESDETAVVMGLICGAGIAWANPWLLGERFPLTEELIRFDVCIAVAEARGGKPLYNAWGCDYAISAPVHLPPLECLL